MDVSQHAREQLRLILRLRAGEDTIRAKDKRRYYTEGKEKKFVTGVRKSGLPQMDRLGSSRTP